MKDILVKLVEMPPAINSTEELMKIIPGLTFKQYEKTLGQAPAGFELLWEAMAAEQAVEMIYLGGSKPGKARVVTPLGVTMMGRLLYLSAYCHQSGINKTFRMDRISSYRKV